MGVEMRVDRSVLSGIFLSCLMVFSLHQVAAQPRFELKNAFPELTFTRPVDLSNDGLGSLYVVEQGGKIFTFPNDSTTGDKQLFLDLSDRVFVGSEAGLLSLSFHPSYAENGFFFVYYMIDDPLRSLLSRFQRSERDPRRADPDSELVLLEIDQPTDRHNGGDTQFGRDGYLYVSLGDGSGWSDSFNNAQNLQTLLGSILRIDVDHPTGGKNYGIPRDNPFVANSQGIREEIYAYGFRNPWRFSIDHETNHLWVGDVGESRWEEVDFVVEGGNYGWPITEGSACFDPPANCVRNGLFPPVYSYSHDVGNSILGGFVYRGRRVPELVGSYLFADWSGVLWSLRYDDKNPYDDDAEPDVTRIIDSLPFISSFGTDENDELYVLSLFHGEVMRFLPTTSLDTEKPRHSAFILNLRISGPNPFAHTTHIELTVGQAGSVRVAAYDVLGREVRVLFDGFVHPGTTSDISFNASSLPSGVYFLRASSAGSVAHERVIFSR